MSRHASPRVRARRADRPDLVAEQLHARWVVARRGFGWSLTRALGWSLVLPVLIGVVSALAAPATAMLLAAVVSIRTPRDGADAAHLIVALSAAVLVQRGAAWSSTVLLRRRCELASAATARALARRAISVGPHDDALSTPLLVARYPEILAQYVFVATLPGTALAVAALIVVSAAVTGAAATAAALGGIVVVALAGYAAEAWEARAGFEVERREAPRSKLMATILSARSSLVRQNLGAQTLAAFQAIRVAQARALRRRSAIASVAVAVREHAAVVALLAALLGLAVVGDLADLGPALTLLVLLRLLGTEIESAMSVLSCVQDARPVLRALRRWLEPPAATAPQAIPLDARIAVLGAAGVGKSALLHRWATTPGPATSLLLDRARPLPPGSIRTAVTLTSAPKDDPDPAYTDAVTAAGLGPTPGGGPDVDAARRVGIDDGLSDGERVRIHLAQAHYWKPDILLLDDIFAALDEDTATAVAPAVLGPRSRSRTVVWTTSRPELLVWADHAVILTPHTTPETAQIVPVEQIHAADLAPVTDTEQSARLLELLAAEPPTATSPNVTDVLGVPRAAQATTSATADLAHTAPTLSIWRRHAIGLYGHSTAAVVAVAGLAAVGATIAAALLSDTDDPRRVLAGLAAVILVGLLATIAAFAVSGARAVTRMTELHRTILTDLLRPGAAAPALARLTTDLHLADFRASERLLGTALGVISTLVVLAVAAASAPAILWTLLPALVLVAVTVRATRAWRAHAQVLAVGSREPLLHHAEAALATGQTFSHPCARAALDQRFGELSDRAFWAGRRSLDIRAALLAGTETVAVVLFTTTSAAALTGTVTATGLSAASLVYLAHTVTTGLAGVVERLQLADSLHANLTRVASLTGHTALPHDLTTTTGPSPTWTTTRGTHALGHGRLTALTGPSGAGKSTLLQDAAAPTDRTGPTSSVALLDPDIPALGLSVADFLDPHHTHRRSDILEVWRDVQPSGPRASADDLVDQLPHGRRQLANLTRAFLRPPDLLLLDEALSALDARTERHTLIELRRLTETRVVIVRHRHTNLDLFDDEIAITRPSPTRTDGTG